VDIIMAPRSGRGFTTEALSRAAAYQGLHPQGETDRVWGRADQPASWMRPRQLRLCSFAGDRSRESLPGPANGSVGLQPSGPLVSRERLLLSFGALLVVANLDQLSFYQCHLICVHSSRWRRVVQVWILPCDARCRNGLKIGACRKYLSN